MHWKEHNEKWVHRRRARWRSKGRPWRNVRAEGLERRFDGQLMPRPSRDLLGQPSFCVCLHSLLEVAHDYDVGERVSSDELRATASKLLPETTRMVSVSDAFSLLHFFLSCLFISLLHHCHRLKLILRLELSSVRRYRAVPSC
jgi:hypothetical protein